MLQIKESVFAKQRASNRGTGTYESGWITLEQMKQLVDAADKAGLNAIGMSPKPVKTAKFTGSVIEIVPFKLAPKKA